MNATSSVGALLLCRAEPGSVRPVAHLLRERMLLAPAGDEWSVLVPEGTPWQDRQEERSTAETEGEQPVDSVLAGWATALAVGSTWPVLALWWDGDRAGYTLASGFRRPVGYVWLTDGTPAGEDEAMRTFAARLGLDPVLDIQQLEALTRPDPEADARTRLRGLLAVLARIGVMLPPGLEPGEPADRLHTAARRPARNATDRVGGLARCGEAGTRRGREQRPRPVDARPQGPCVRRGPACRGSPARRLGDRAPQRRVGLRGGTAARARGGRSRVRPDPGRRNLVP